MKKNLISIGALKVRGLKGTLADDVLKILKGLMVVLKGVRWINLYYLKGSIVTGKVVDSKGANDDSTRPWHMRLGHTREIFASIDEARIVESAKTCKLKFSEHCVIGKKTKVEFGIVIHLTE